MQAGGEIRDRALRPRVIALRLLGRREEGGSLPRNNHGRRVLAPIVVEERAIDRDLEQRARRGQRRLEVRWIVQPPKRHQPCLGSQGRAMDRRVGSVRLRRPLEQRPHVLREEVADILAFHERSVGECVCVRVNEFWGDSHLLHRQGLYRARVPQDACMANTNSDDVLELPLTLRVPRSTFVLVAAPPATVTQKTAEAHFGIPERAFKTMARDGLFPVKRIGRLLFASYDSVRNAVTQGAEQRARFTRAIDAAAREPAKEPIAIEEATRYMETAVTPREFRQRRDEINAIASDLLSKFDEKLEDGSPNPNYDKRLHDHAYSLYYRAIVAAAGRRAPRRPR